MKRHTYWPPRRPSVLYAVVRGEIRASEFADDLARIEAKRPLRVVIDFSSATSIEAGAIVALLGLKRRLAAEGVFFQVIATARFAAELTSQPSSLRSNPTRLSMRIAAATRRKKACADDDRSRQTWSRTVPEGD